MRILHVMGEMGYGGAELLTLELSKILRRGAADISIAVLGPCDPGLRQRIEHAGIRLIHFDSRVRSPLNMLRLRHLVQSEQYDIVHAHLFPAIYVAAGASLFAPAGTCWIYTEHSTANRRRARGWLKPVERWAYGRFMGIVCVSDEVRNALISFLPGLAAKTVTINNGVDIQRFAAAEPVARAQLELSRDDLVVVMAGAFRTEKNQANLVRSVALLPSRYKLVLAGDGPEMGNVRRAAEECGVADRVRFLGAVGNVASVLKASDVYVLPSLFEGLPLSPIEAAAAGLPIVYSDVAGLRSLCSGVGVPVVPTDPQSIAQGILFATEDEERRSSLVRKSHALAQQYDLDASARLYGASYAAWRENARLPSPSNCTP